MNKVTIVTGSTARNSLWEYSSTQECDISFAYIGSKSMFLSGMRNLWLKLKLPCVRLWYDRRILKWMDTLIIFDPNITMHYLRWIMRNSNAGRFIFYYWNTYLKGRIDPDEVKKLGYEVWTFDLADSNKYHMKYNPQMYFPSWYEAANKEQKQHYDIVFVGRDKSGRMRQIEKLAVLFKKQNINYYFYFVSRKWYQRFNSSHYSKFLDYREMINEELKGKAILDCPMEGQSGLTLRIYDALCNERKVVTNNAEIKRYGFYSKANVFVLGEDDEDDLAGFIQSSFLPIDQAVLREYSIEGWLRRFEEESEC